MRKLCSLLLSFSLIAPLGLAQQNADEPSTPAIRVSTHYVLVDTIITDKSGQPVLDLKPEDITIKENGKAQKLAHFSLEKRDASSAKAATSLPAGVYSNRPELEAANPGPMSILLLDGLNTTTSDMQSARKLMLNYLDKNFQPGQNMAIYLLTNRLIRLKDFTDNGDDLKKILQQYKPGAVANSPDPGQLMGNQATTELARGAGPGATVQVLRNFVADAGQVNFERRVRSTIAALRELALVTGGKRGRKNLIWLSAGVPITVSPEPFGRTAPAEVQLTLNPAGHSLSEETGGGGTMDLMESLAKDMHTAALLLTESQIAVYPVDARGLFNGGVNSGDVNMFIGGGDQYGGRLLQVFGGIANTQENMREIADQTGGIAFVNRNDLDKAVALAANDGQYYYDFAYTSANKKFDGAFRKIKVEVNRPGLVVRHRQGYFALDPFTVSKKGKTDDISVQAGNASFIQFDALIAPTGAQGGKSQVPVKFRVQPSTISALEKGDKRGLDLDFYVVAANASDDKVIVNTGQTLKMDIDKGQFEQMSKQGLMIAVPVELAAGNYVFRLAVQDHNSGAVGTLTAPVKVQ